VIFALLISLVAIAYYVVYSFVLVGSTKFENKTIMILLIIGYLVGVVAIIGLIMTLAYKEQDESK